MIDFRQLDQQFADEARRLITEREASQSPKLPTQTNQIYAPGQGGDGRSQEQVQADAARDHFASQLIGRLADRDERHR